MKNIKKAKEQEEKIDLEFKVIKKGKTEGAYSVYNEKSKKYKKKDVKINAIKKKSKHTFLAVLVLVVIGLAVYFGITKINKKEEVNLPVNNDDNIEEDIVIENDKPSEEVKPVIKDISLNLDEGKKLTKFVQGTVIDEDYEDIAEIANKNKIKIVINQVGLKTGYINLAGEEALGIDIEDFDIKAEKIFGENNEIIYATTREYEYNSKNNTFTKIANQYEGYKEVEIPIVCTKEEDKYTLKIAHAEGYIEDHTYIISGTSEKEISAELSTTALVDDLELVRELKKYAENLDEYEYTIKENTDGTLKIISFKKL